MLINDIGKSEKEPYNWPASTNDVQSWGRLHRGVRDALAAAMKAAQGGADTSTVATAGVWMDESEKYSDLDNVGLGFEAAWDFGFKPSADLVRETVASAKEGKRLHDLVIKQAGISGGDDIGGVTDNEVEAPSSLGTFLGGALLAGGAFAAYKLFGPGAE